MALGLAEPRQKKGAVGGHLHLFPPSWLSAWPGCRPVLCSGYYTGGRHGLLIVQAFCQGKCLYMDSEYEAEGSLEPESKSPKVQDCFLTVSLVV